MKTGKFLRMKVSVEYRRDLHFGYNRRHFGCAMYKRYYFLLYCIRTQFKDSAEQMLIHFNKFQVDNWLDISERIEYKSILLLCNTGQSINKSLIDL